MYKDEAFRFIRLGTFIERADSTARMIDLRFQDIEQQDAVSGMLDPHDPKYAVREFYHWEAVLRSLSAFEAYRKVYRDTISGSRVAELLILNKDIHGNLEALEAVLAGMEEQGVTHPLCLGDLVGYGANPAECLEVVRAMGCPVVRGNHDDLVPQGKAPTSFSDAARQSLDYSRKQLNPAQLNFLRRLPMIWAEDPVTLVGRPTHVFTTCLAHA